MTDQQPPRRIKMRCITCGYRYETDIDDTDHCHRCGSGAVMVR